MKKPAHTIAYVIDGLSLGGAERQVAILARSLPQRYRPIVIALSDRLDPFGNDLISRGIDVVTLSRRSHNDPRRLLGLTRLLKDSGVKIVHGWLDAANAYAYAAGRMLGKPVVLSLRSEVLRVTRGKAAVLTWMLRHADGVLVNSAAGKEFLESKLRVPHNKIIHIRNWVDPEHAALVRELPGDDASPTIGFVGRFEKPKQLHLLVAAFQFVLERLPAARLILMGGGSERAALVDQAADLGIAASIEFADPNPAVHETMKRFHILALPSAFEGLPNAAIESLAMGIPIVSTRVGDVAQLIADGQTGVFFENEVPADMAETLTAALTDRQLMESALHAGPRLVEKNFAIDRALPRLLHTYDRLTGSGK